MGRLDRHIGHFAQRAEHAGKAPQLQLRRHPLLLAELAKRSIARGHRIQIQVIFLRHAGRRGRDARPDLPSCP